MALNPQPPSFFCFKKVAVKHRSFLYKLCILFRTLFLEKKECLHPKILLRSPLPLSFLIFPFLSPSVCPASPRSPLPLSLPPVKINTLRAALFSFRYAEPTASFRALLSSCVCPVCPLNVCFF